MPSSYDAYAVDYDGDGRRDIWTSLPDVFASIANYLAKAGWNDRHTWGRKVDMPAALNGDLVGLETARPLPQWQELGVRRADGANLPAVTLNASLLQHRRRPGSGLSRLRQLPRPDGVEPLDLFRAHRGRARGSDRARLSAATVGERSNAGP